MSVQLITYLFRRIIYSHCLPPNNTVLLLFDHSIVSKNVTRVLQRFIRKSTGQPERTKFFQLRLVIIEPEDDSIFLLQTFSC